MLHSNCKIKVRNTKEVDTMTKKEIIKYASELLKDIEDRKAFCEKNEIDESDFYPFALGWITAGLQFIEVDGDILKMK